MLRAPGQNDGELFPFLAFYGQFLFSASRIDAELWFPLAPAEDLHRHGKRHYQPGEKNENRHGQVIETDAL